MAPFYHSRFTDLLKKLIAFPTLSRSDLSSAFSWCGDLLERAGFTVLLPRHPHTQRLNLCAIRGPRDRPSLLLSGHLDVVPVTGQPWKGDPFALRFFDNRFIGRGTADMKGFIATLLQVVSTLDLTKMRRPLMILLTTDEEIGCLGARDIFELLPGLGFPPPAMALIGEPTSFQIFDRHKGIQKCRVEAFGTSAHSAHPHLGDNAISRMGGFLVFLESLREELKRERQESYRPPYPTLNPAIITGGEAINIIPARCLLDFEFRTFAEFPPDRILHRIGEFLARDPSHWRLELLPSSPPFRNPKSGPLGPFLQAKLGQTTYTTGAFNTEGSVFQEWPTEIYVCGPGSIEVAHQPEESIAIGDILKCYSLLGDLIPHFCLGDGAISLP